MPLKARHLLLLALVACTSERPKGAYEPSYPEAGAECVAMPGVPNPCLQPDAGDEEPTDDAPGDEDDSDDVGPELDGGEPDSGFVDPANPLSALQGRYLMRVDYYSTAKGTDTATGVTLSVKNRVSNLFLVTLTAGDGVLQASEQLCVQGSAHQCLQSCANWVTQYDEDLPPLYAAKSKVERVWTVDTASKVLTVPTARLALGFDPDADFTLPTDINAANVWQAGDTNAVVQRGLHTFVGGNLGPLQTRLACNINSVLVFGTAFSRALTSLDEAGMNKFLAPIDPAGTKGEPIDATGEPSQFCDANTLKTGGTSSDQKGFVRLKKTTRTTCPTTASAFDKEFPLGTGANLDPPQL